MHLLVGLQDQNLNDYISRVRISRWTCTLSLGLLQGCNNLVQKGCYKVEISIWVVDFMVFKPSANVFPCFLHYLSELTYIWKAKIHKSFPVNSEFYLQLWKFPPPKFCCIQYVLRYAHNLHIVSLRYPFPLSENYHTPLNIQN